MLIATAGHVDHGKTSLVKALTGVDTDRLPEEKKRGLTIDLGFAHTDLANGQRVSFVDVPGHERFVRNMVAGIGGIDHALLVIAADDGVMPQTIEHLAIIDLLGVKAGAIALTKADRVDGERLADVRREIATFLAGSALAKAQIFVASGLTGDGVPALLGHLAAVADSLHAHADEGNFRLAVDRSFLVQGVGLVATGTIHSGQVNVNDRIVVAPAGIEARVRGLRAKDQPVEAAAAGVRCAVNLAGGDLAPQQLKRGCWLVNPRLDHASRRIDVRMRLLPSEAAAMKHWTPAHFHLGTTDIPCRVALLEERDLLPGSTALAQLLLDYPTLAVAGDHFILRDQSAQRTIGGGRIVDPFGPARGRARPERLDWLDAYDTTDHKAALQAILKRSDSGVDLIQFALARNLTEGEAAEILSDSEVTMAGGDIGFSGRHWTGICDDILKLIASWHQARPEDQGPGEDAIRADFGRPISLAVLQSALQQCLKSGALARSGSAWHFPDHKAQASEREMRIWQRLEPILEAAGHRSLRDLEIVEELNISASALQGFLRRAARLGLVYRVSQNRVFLPVAVFDLARSAEELAADGEDGLFSAAEFRDKTKIGRNLAIEVLEFLDKSGLTRRVGNMRRVVRPVDDVFTKPEATLL